MISNLGMSLGRGPARPGLARAFQKVIFGIWPTVGQAHSFWPKFGPGRKNMAQTQLIGMSLGYILVWPGPARPGPGLIDGHFWGLAHRGPGRFILAQVRPGPEKNGPNSTHRDEFRLRPGPGLIEGHFWGLACHGPGRAGPGPSLARAGKKWPKLIPT